MRMTYAYPKHRIDETIANWAKLGWDVVKMEPAFLGRMTEPHFWLTFVRQKDLLNTVIVRQPDVIDTIFRYRDAGKRIVRWSVFKPGLVTLEFEVDPNHGVKIVREEMRPEECKPTNQEGCVKVQREDRIKIREYGPYDHTYEVIDTNYQGGYLCRRIGKHNQPDYLVIIKADTVVGNLTAIEREKEAQAKCTAQVGKLYYREHMGFCYWWAVTPSRLQGVKHGVRQPFGVEFDATLFRLCE